MRRLLYVPIVHEESDLGTLGPALEEASAALVGASRWARHKETVAAFWKAIGDYLATVDARSLKIYQDGLAAGGQLGRRVVEEAARRGSKNHQILLELMDRGAQIRETEDLSLLLEEGRQLLSATQGGGSATTPHDRSEYERQKERLTRERDRAIAARINETLKEEESGALFIGAYHDVISHLAPDIQVTQVKDREKVRAYFQELLSGADGHRLADLARHITSPVQESA